MKYDLLIKGGTLVALLGQLEASHGWLDEAVRRRLAGAYGTRVWRLLEGARSAEDLGTHFGAGLYEIEVRYLVAHEWARTIEDILGIDDDQPASD